MPLPSEDPDRIPETPTELSSCRSKKRASEPLDFLARACLYEGGSDRIGDEEQATFLLTHLQTNGAERTARNVKRWQSGEMALRSTAAGMLEAGTSSGGSSATSSSPSCPSRSSAISPPP